MTDPKERILLGQIARVHGVRGEMVVRSFTADPADVAAYGPLSDKSGTRHFDLTLVRSGPKGVVVRIAGVQDRDAAEALRGTELYVAREALPAPEADAFYHADLAGLSAVDGDGAALGTVTGVHNYGAGDFLEVALAAGGSVLVPFTNANVPDVDLASRRATIVPPLDDDGEAEPGQDNGA